MNVLSLFDGISCGHIALEKLGIKVDKYFASEIDKNAIKVTQHNFPETIQLGDVTGVRATDLPKIDLLIGGSPCQGFSLSGKQLNFDDPRSKLFFEFVRLLKETKPKHFLLENVKMKKEYQDIITEFLGVEPVFINSKDLSAQSRGRWYWTNIPFEREYKKKKEVYLKDVLEPYYDSGTISDDEIQNQLTNLLSTSKYRDTFKWKRDTQNRVLVTRPDGLKIQRIGRIGEGVHKSEIITVLTQPFVFDGKEIRKVNPLEAERLQTVPDGYTAVNGTTDNMRYKMLGNGWTVDVIAHIFGGLA
ncbi:MAG: hypothetical protein CMD83_17945 [Gammaproteobacteria bacterium]|nr:hypothetical protein [Gammaproteobacteria bacterium]